MELGVSLNNNISTILENGTDFNNLSSKQIGTLRAIADNRVNSETISERMMEAIEDLQIMGFVTRDLKLTVSGSKAVELAAILGGSQERRRAATIDEVEVRDEDVYVDNDTLPEHDRFYPASNKNRFM